MKKRIFLVLLVAFMLVAASVTAVWGAVNGEEALEKQMLELVNAERAKAGVGPLKMDAHLVQLARLKSHDMIDNNYFSHTSPTYGSPFEMMDNYGVDYLMAGENLAGNPSLTGGHEALMNSPGHRANILKPEFTHIGIGVVKGGKYGLMITQMFIKAKGDTTEQNLLDVEKIAQESPVEIESSPSELDINEEKEVNKITNNDTNAKLKIFVRNKQVSFPDAQPYINEQRIMVPIRFVSQALNCQVDWDAAEQKILINDTKEQAISLWIGKNVIAKGNKLYVGDTMPELKNGRTLVPLRMVSELLGSEVIWYPQLKKVDIN